MKICKRCTHCYPDFKGLLDIKFACELKKPEFNTDDETKDTQCTDYDSRYIEYPIVVSKIDTSDNLSPRNSYHPTGCFVKVRPCAEEYGNKTYLGIFLGEFASMPMASYNRETQVLEFYAARNPCMFVPSLKKVIFGYESWWGEIKDETELKEITDADIDSVWYVKMLKSMGEKSDN